ncbi:DUF192 domain-containing protein [Caldimonas brevitalea]|uniref:TadE-like domain-containing protein n=1 Tax=Caldimonas brevitalea TaxID=413882 RepID=A0A0G3BUG5_9BURK|nr:DUF192 domain-containing protein [Caldimonas brevitalea]AKJ31663.1 hypothetical protein AAW51_4972 [Caldimonas brevitalea]
MARLAARTDHAAERAEFAVIYTATGAWQLRVRVAVRFWSRWRGLMLSPPLRPDAGLLIPRCASVHTCFMRYALDLVYLDAAGRVVACVPALKPWRANVCRVRGPHHGAAPAALARHCLELAAGTVAALGIRPGDAFAHGYFAPHDGEGGPPRPGGHAAAPTRPRRQRGAAMVEFAVVGPLLTLLGLAVVQYGLLFFAKNQINYATFMAARAGSTGHANVDAIRLAYARNVLALYGGGRSSSELAESLTRAAAEVAEFVEVRLLNPTRESYDDWNDAQLENAYGARAIRHAGLAARDPEAVGTASGQSVHDANLIKLKITHGYRPSVPLVGMVYTRYLQWMDTGNDAAYTRLVNAGRVPIVSHVTLQMQSDPIEGPVESHPGPGNDGSPSDPGDPPRVDTPPPECQTIGCSVPPVPIEPPGGGDGGTCDPATDPNGCRPPGCEMGDPSCDPGCGTSYCCVPPDGQI